MLQHPIINSADDLSKIGNDASYPLSGSYILTKNIEISGDWLSIGNNDFPFTGIFDGNGNSITFTTETKILRSTGPTDNVDGAGLFGNIKSKSNSTCVIKNLNIVAKGNLSSSSYFGTLVGYSTGGSVENCSVQFFDDFSINGSSSVGGLLGYNEEGTVKNCTFIGNVRADSNYAGGLVGNMKNGSIENSHQDGNVNATLMAGGLIGQATNVNIRNCSATGNIHSGSNSGGLIGRVFENGTIENSFAICNATSSNKAGGLVGGQDVFNMSIRNSYAIGTIIASGYGAGGLIGTIDNGSIETSYFVGTVLASNNRMGGLIGSTNSDINILDSFYSDDIESNKYGTAVPDQDMKQISTYLSGSPYLNSGSHGWNISQDSNSNNIWYIINGEDYPRLSWSYKPPVIEEPVEVIEDLPQVVEVSDAEVEKNMTPFYLYILFGIVLLIIFSFTFLFFKKRKSNSNK
ncbi:GLUG motif-containing protein [Methanolapillus millepedarum]|uniref:GLUG domain-containing protein n=1 Tax=Methanolapillus millepedarum TaxID=3028296 RepID=A0AA96V2C1_9EURY|nr:hypothetical protein MsAc7_02120 [Methanosarcinaceae archaeon Ac7]